MGDYTGLRMKAKVKKEYSSMIEDIFYGENDWDDYLYEFEFLSKFVSLDRASCIPRGSICYMPYSWSEWSPDYGEDIKEGFDCKYDKNTRLMSFATSTKSTSTLRWFIEDVCPHILEESYHVELYYEYWDTSEMYKICNGKVIEVAGIRYREPEPDYWRGY